MPLEFYSCKACDKIFNGKRPYEDHIVSEKHQKKMMQKNAAQSPTVVDSTIRFVIFFSNLQQKSLFSNKFSISIFDRFSNKY